LITDIYKVSGFGDYEASYAIVRILSIDDSYTRYGGEYVKVEGEYEILYVQGKNAHKFFTVGQKRWSDWVLGCVTPLDIARMKLESNC
jgi:hypothetical protein